MKEKTTIFKMRIVHVLSCFLLTLLSSINFYGQTKNYPTATSNGIRAWGLISGNESTNSPVVNGIASVSNISGSVSSGTYSADLSATSKDVLGLGYGGEAWVQFDFRSIPQGSKVYIPFSEIKTGGLGLDLLETVLGLLSLIENDNINVTVFNGTSEIADNLLYKDIVVDETGQLYLVVSSDTATFNNVRFRLKYLPGLLSLNLGSNLSTSINSAFYLTNEACSPALFSDLGKTTGINVNLGDVVKNPSFAIDDNTSSYSQISTGILAVVATAVQNIYFPALSEPTSTLKVRLGIETSTLNLDLLGAYRIRVFNGNTLVQSFPLQSGLVNGLDLLGLLGNNGATTVSFSVTNGAYDRVEIGLSTTVGVNVDASTLRIYDVSRSSANCPEPPPTTSPLISPVCANVDIVSSDYVDDAAYATDGNFDSYASIRSGTGILLGLGNTSGHLEVNFPSAGVPANKTTYIRIDYDEDVLKSLLAGSLGNTVGGLVNGLLLGEHYFDIHLTNAGSNVLQTSSIDNFSNSAGQVRIVQDAAGRYYIAIKSTEAFTNLRITDHTNAVVGLLAPDQFLNVYSICYEASDAICDPAFSTSYDGSGLVSLNLLDLGNNGVTNAQYAIDGDPSTKSEINLGVANATGSMTQFVNFNTLSNPEDHFNVTLSLNNGALADVSLVSNIEIKAYAGEEVVFTQKLSEDILGLDLLGLLSNGQAATLRISPGKAFDRISIGKSALLDVNLLSSPLYVHEVERFSANCPDTELQWDPKTDSPFNTPACVNELGSFENVNFPHEAITDNPTYDTYATLSAGAGLAAGLGAYSSHIELKYAGTGATAHEVSYIRVDSEGNLFDALLGGSLGDALGNLLGSVALGNQYIVVQALDAAGNPVGAAHSSATGFNTEFVRLVKDKDGKFYLAVTAPDAYQAVRVEYHHTALVGAMGSSALKVYSMCRETEFDPCEQATFVSWDGSGIGLDIADLTNGGVANPEFSIDADNSNYATLNVGVAGIGATVSHFTYFKTKSDIADKLRIRLQLANPGILNVDLFGSSKLVFYNGEQNVKEMTLASGLINNLDLLGLFNSGGVQSFTFAPGVVYDRVELKISTLVAVGTSAPIRLYGMSRLSADCPDPDFLLPTDVFNSPVCADGVEIANVRAVDDVDFAIDGDYNSYATMRADAGTIFGIGNEESILEIKYQNPVVANTTSYLRIGDDAGLLESLLSGSLGEVVYGLLNNVALGDNYFVVRAKNGANTVLEGSSRNGFADANGLMKIVQDKAGRYFVAISPNVDYTSVEIKAFSEAILGITAQGYNLHVYGMCYETDFSGCAEGFSTSWDGSGLAVGVTGVGSYGVTDAFKALNNNNNSDFSTLSLGTLNVAGHIQQNIQYNKNIVANTPFRLKMEVGTGTVNVAVFDNINIVGYKDGIEVYNQPLQTAVLGGVSLGTLFNNGGAHDVTFAINNEVDELALRINSLANVSVGPDVRLYYIVQDCDTPMFRSWKSFEVDADPAITSVKGGEEVEYTIHVRNIGSTTLDNFIVTDVIPANTTFVSAANGGVENAGVITFTGINVAVGATETVSFKVKVNDDLTGVANITNVALVKIDANDPGTETFPPSSTDPNEPDVTGGTGTDIPVDAIYDFTVVKNGISNNATNTNQAELGNQITYTITVTNTGNNILTNISVKDILLNSVPGEVSIVNNGGGTVNANEITFNIASLAVGASATITVVTQVQAVPTSGNISNKAEVSYTTPGNVSVEKEVTFDMASSCINLDASVIELVSSAVGCPGEAVTLTATLSATAPAITNPVYKWYLNSNLSDTPQIGASITVNPTVNTTYYVTVEGLGYCFTTPAKEIEVTVLPTGMATDIDIIAPATVCQGENVTFTASLATGTTIVNPVFKWYTDANLSQLVFEGNTFNIIATPDLVGIHTLYVTVEGDAYCENAVGNAATHTIMVNVAPQITVNGSQAVSVVAGNAFSLPTATTANGAAIQWYDSNNDPIDGRTSQTISTPGVYTYTVVATLNGCTAFQNIIVTVFDAADCPPVLERVYANDRSSWGSIITGGVANTNNAIDENPKTYSTITTGVGLLGIGTTWQNIYFDHTVAAGTPVTVKLGKEYSGLMLAGGLSVQGLDANGNTIGTLKTVDGGLLDLLVADNVIEFTFVPSNSSGPKAYAGVRVSQGALLSVAQNAKVYGAYYTQTGTINCAAIDANTNPNILDVLHGVEDLGVGAASATASVVNPWNAVDNDMTSYAQIVRGVAVLNQASLTAVFKQQATAGDELQIVIEVPANPVLQLELIKGYTIQRYLGDTPVGPALDSNSGILELKLLGLLGGTTNKAVLIVAPFNEPYDRVKISYGSVVGVLGDFTRIYDISMKPTFNYGADLNGDFTMCSNDPIVFIPVDACTTYQLYTSATGADKLDTTYGLTFTLPRNITAGSHTFYVQAIRNGCEVGPRQEITIEVERCSKGCIISNRMVTNKIKK